MPTPNENELPPVTNETIPLPPQPRELEAREHGYVCELNDSIFTVAAKTLGHSDLWPQIMAANPEKRTLSNGQPARIDVGETFLVPQMGREEAKAALLANRKRWAEEEEAAKVPEHLRGAKK